MVLKYPRTACWPDSPAVPRDDAVLAEVGQFVGSPVVITEKLDGSNTLLHRGEVYGRSVAAPSTAKWLAMVKKHHAWKIQEPDVLLYGEDIYGVHSVAYDPVREDATFYAFVLRRLDGSFAPFRTMVSYARERDIPIVPVLFEGVFDSVDRIRRFIRDAHAQPSALGGEREGVVMRLARGFSAEEFRRSVCKSVRANHVQSDEHWTRNWKPCRIARA